MTFRINFSLLVKNKQSKKYEERQWLLNGQNWKQQIEQIQYEKCIFYLPVLVML